MQFSFPSRRIIGAMENRSVGPRPRPTIAMTIACFHPTTTPSSHAPETSSSFAPKPPGLTDFWPRSNIARGAKMVATYTVATSARTAHAVGVGLGRGKLRTSIGRLTPTANSCSLTTHDGIFVWMNIN